MNLSVTLFFKYTKREQYNLTVNIYTKGEHILIKSKNNQTMNFNKANHLKNFRTYFYEIL